MVLMRTEAGTGVGARQSYSLAASQPLGLSLAGPGLEFPVFFLSKPCSSSKAESESHFLRKLSPVSPGPATSLGFPSQPLKSALSGNK